MSVERPPSDSGDRPRSQDFQQFLRERSLAIAARAREAGFFGHMLTRGMAREDVLREPLEEILPDRFGVTTGEVRACDGQVSGQWDVLVCSRPETPTLYKSGATIALPIEGVLAGISVKSTVDRAAIQEAADSAALLRGMPRRTLSAGPVRNLGPSPAVFVFGFDGLSLETLADHVRDACEGVGSPKVLSGVCVFGRGLITPVNEAGNPAPEDITNYRIAHASDGAWGIFLALLWSALTFLTVTPVAPICSATSARRI